MGRTSYESDQEHNQGFREFQRKLDKFRKTYVPENEEEGKGNEEEEQGEGSRKDSDDDEDEAEQNARKKQSKHALAARQQIIPISERGEISRTREGVLLPERNAFEFTVRPESRKIQAKKTNQESGRHKLMKSLLKLKRGNAMTQSANKHMAVVKYDN